MVIGDPISDMLVRITNAGKAGRQTVEVPYSSLKLALANTLMKEGFVGSVTRKIKRGKRDVRVLEIVLLYDTVSISGRPKQARVRGLERVSKPSRRVYLGAADLKPVQQGHGIMVLSTPKGLMTDKEARKEHVGGEVLCKAW